MNPTRLISTSAVLTLGDPASWVFSSPKTAHGWRPISVNVHPVSEPTNGRMAAGTAQVRKRRDSSSRPCRSRHHPHAPIRNMSTAVAIIARQVQ